MEMTVTQGALIHTAPGAAGTAHRAGLPEEAPGSLRKQRERLENVGNSLYGGFCKKERVKQPEQV